MIYLLDSSIRHGEFASVSVIALKVEGSTEQLSVTVPLAFKNCCKDEYGGNTDEPHWNVRFPGQLITGGILSSTMITWIKVSLFPQ